MTLSTQSSGFLILFWSYVSPRKLGEKWMDSFYSRVWTTGIQYWEACLKKGSNSSCKEQ